MAHESLVLFAFVMKCFIFSLVPQTPTQITASSILSRSLTLSWNLSAPSPGNTVYTIFVYEAYDEGKGYKPKENLTVYGLYRCR